MLIRTRPPIVLQISRGAKGDLEDPPQCLESLATSSSGGGGDGTAVVQELLHSPMALTAEGQHGVTSLADIISNVTLDPSNLVISTLQDLTPDLLGNILIHAGTWKAGGTTLAAWNVCREWRDCLRDSPSRLGDLLIEVFGAEGALKRAAGLVSHVVDTYALVRYILQITRMDCSDGGALSMAAISGHSAVHMLLEWPEHAPHADCRDGEALYQAAGQGHEAVLRMLLEWPEHAPRADCQAGEALCRAAVQGREAVLRMLLEWPEHAPRADCQAGEALCNAAGSGHVAVVRMLLDWPEHAPRADCQNGEALHRADAHPNVLLLLHSYVSTQQLQQ